MTCLISYVTGWAHAAEDSHTKLELAPFMRLFSELILRGVVSLPFWIATFSLTMIVTFENMGLLHGLLPDQKSFQKHFRPMLSRLLSREFSGQVLPFLP